MKYLLFFCWLWMNPLLAQQHLSGNWSLSTGVPLNTQGRQLVAHYHLNSFDELRFGYHFVNRMGKDSSNFNLNTKLVSVTYAQGFKLPTISKTGIYLGAGAFFGKEKIDTLESITNNITGIHLLSEIEYAPLNWLSFFIGLNWRISLTKTNSKNLQVILGTRFYF